MNKPAIGDLRIWWIPQVPGKSFCVSVASVERGVELLDVLANYDIFQFENRIKPDYCNAGGLQVFDADGWSDWCNDDFDDPKEYLESLASKTA